MLKWSMVFGHAVRCSGGLASGLAAMAVLFSPPVGGAPAKAADAGPPDCQNVAVSGLLQATDMRRRDGFGVRLIGASLMAADFDGDNGMFDTLRRRVLTELGRETDNAETTLPKAGTPVGLTLDALPLALEGRYAQAEALYNEALRVSRAQGHALGEAASLNNLGAIAAAQGRFGPARELFQAAVQRHLALEAAQAAAPAPAAAASPAAALAPAPATAAAAPASAPAGRLAGAAGAARAAFGSLLAKVSGAPPPAAQPDNTGATTSASLAAAPEAAPGIASAIRQAGMRTRTNLLVQQGLQVALLNAANLDAELGQYAEAEQLMNQALAKSRDPVQRLSGPGVPDDSARVQVDLAVLYQKTGKAEQARQARAQAERMDAARPRNPRTEPPMLLLGGSTVADAGRADPCRNEAERERPSHYAEAGHQWLASEAKRLEAAGDLPGAMSAHARAAALAMVVDSAPRERDSWAALQRLAAGRSAPAQGIFYGKLAVNAAQRLRGSLDGLSREARQGFLADKRRSYALLASQLMDGGRLPEAETVLRLLKEDEGQQFLGGSAETVRGSVPYTRAEAAWLASLQQAVADTRALEAQRTRLLRQGLAGLIVIDQRQAQERYRTGEQLKDMEGFLDNNDGPKADKTKRDEELRRMQATLAKPRSARSGEEQMQVTVGRGVTAYTLERTQDMDASLRALERDAPFFTTPLSAADKARIRTLQTRLAAFRERLAGTLAMFKGEPDTPMPAALQPLIRLGTGGLQDKTAQHWAIDRQLEAVEARQAELRQALPEALAREPEPVFDSPALEALATGQRTLAALPAGTVALYYLLGEQRLDVLVVGPQMRRALRVPVARATLERQVADYRQLLQQPSSRPEAAARALYQVLVAPLADTLREAQARTLMLSLDGALRYLPFAALHDGKGWLVERYALNVYTSASPAALVARPAPRWRVAAFGTTAAASVSGLDFPALPAVRAELDGIVRRPGVAGRGSLPGTARLDAVFTRDTLREALREGPSVLHIASHFAFLEGDPRRSFLLLGDRSGLSLAELASPAYRFDRVDLVTLSACETALSSGDGFGQEVESLGTLLQAQGAAAVLATLWEVNDDSTSAFMRAMYRLRETQGLSRAQAVRDAQLLLLRGATVASVDALPLPPQDGDPPTAARGATREGAEPPPPTPPPRPGPWTHPNHWAPFVLMGNWL